MLTEPSDGIPFNTVADERDTEEEEDYEEDGRTDDEPDMPGEVEKIVKETLRQREEILSKVEEINNGVKAIGEKELREAMITTYGGVQLDKQEEWSYR